MWELAGRPQRLMELNALLMCGNEWLSTQLYTFWVSWQSYTMMMKSPLKNNNNRTNEVTKHGSHQPRASFWKVTHELRRKESLTVEFKNVHFFPSYLAFDGDAGGGKRQAIHKLRATPCRYRQLNMSSSYISSARTVCCFNHRRISRNATFLRSWELE